MKKTNKRAESGSNKSGFGYKAISRFLLFVSVMVMFIASVSSVIGLGSTLFPQEYGVWQPYPLSGTVEWNTAQANSGSYSAYLQVNYPSNNGEYTSDSNEIYILPYNEGNLLVPAFLDDLDSFSFWYSRPDGGDPIPPQIDLWLATAGDTTENEWLLGQIDLATTYNTWVEVTHSDITWIRATGGAIYGTGSEGLTAAKAALGGSRILGFGLMVGSPATRDNDRTMEGKYYIDDIKINGVVYGFERPTEAWVDDDDATCGSNSPCYDNIQEAIDIVASEGTVNVAAGAYEEQITIDKSLNLIGVGKATTTIKATTTGRSTVSQPNSGYSDIVWDYVVAAYPSSGTIDVKIQGFTIDANLQGGSSANNFAGVFLRDVGDGLDDGLYSCTIQNFGSYGSNPNDWSGTYGTWMGNYGTIIYGTSDLTINDNDINDYTVSGVSASGVNVDVTVTNNDLDGTSSDYAGLYLRDGIGTISGNNIHDHDGVGENMGIYLFDAGLVSIDGSISANLISENYLGMMLAGTDGATISGNTFTDNTYRSIVIQQDSDNNVVKGNTITMSGADVEAGIVIGSDSGGNIIGGDTAEDGNDLTLPTTSTIANVPYAIYMSSVDIGDVTIKNNDITGGQRAVQFDGGPGHSGTNTISNNTITGSLFGGIISSCHGDFVISGNTITGTDRPLEFWQSGNGDLTITGNIIDSTTYDGINIGSANSLVSFTENIFKNIDGKTALAYRLSNDVNAENNYWGTPNDIELKIVHKVDNAAYGTVDYTPWYAEEAKTNLVSEDAVPDTSAVEVSPTPTRVGSQFTVTAVVDEDSFNEATATIYDLNGDSVGTQTTTSIDTNKVVSFTFTINTEGNYKVVVLTNDLTLNQEIEDNDNKETFEVIAAQAGDPTVAINSITDDDGVTLLGGDVLIVSVTSDADHIYDLYINNVKKGSSLSGSVTAGYSITAEQTAGIHTVTVRVVDLTSQREITTSSTYTVSTPGEYYTKTEADGLFATITGLAIAVTDMATQTWVNGLYVLQSNFNSLFDTQFGSKTTDDLAEGANLYFTDIRAVGAIDTAYPNLDITSADDYTQTQHDAADTIQSAADVEAAETDPTVDLPKLKALVSDDFHNLGGTDANTQLSEAEVDTYVANNGYASSGANSDITSLTGLTSPFDVTGEIRAINDGATSFRLRGKCDGAVDDGVFDSDCQSYAGIFYNTIFDNTGGTGARTTRAVYGSNEDMDLEIQGSNHIRITAVDDNVGTGRIRLAAEDQVQLHIGAAAETDAAKYIIFDTAGDVSGANPTIETNAGNLVLIPAEGSVDITGSLIISGSVDGVDIGEFKGIYDAFAATKGANNGLATLDASGKVLSTQLSALAITNTHVVADITARDALSVEEGDVAIVTDSGDGRSRSYIYDGSAWQEIKTPTDAVDSVNGETGTVTLTTEDITEVANLYYTDARARAAISADSSLIYNSGTGVISIPPTIARTSDVTEADTTLQSNIDTEKGRAITAENILTTNLDTETTFRQANESGQQTRIDSLESRALQNTDGIDIYLTQGWNTFKLPWFVLDGDGTAQLNGLDVPDYEVTTVLSDLYDEEDNALFSYLAYYNGTDWKVYVPDEIEDDFIVFPTDATQEDFDFHIYMTEGARLTIPTIIT